jgi:hypothetical protein
LTDTGTDVVERNDCLGTARLPNRQRWGIGVEGNLSNQSMVITDCTFKGHETALDLYDASVVVEGNEFLETKGVAIWVHSTEWTPPTQDLWTANTFSGVKGLRFLATTSATLWIWYDQYSLASLWDDHLAITVPYLPLDEMIYATDDTVLIAMPRYLLDGDGSGGVVDTATVTHDDGLSPPIVLTLNTSLEVQDFFIGEEPLFPGPGYLMYNAGLTELWATDTCGTIEIVHTIDYLYLYGPNRVFLQLRLDGELVRTFDVFENMETEGLIMEDFHHLQPIPSGPSLLNVTIVSYDENGTNEQLVDTFEANIFRVTDTNDTEAAIDAVGDLWTWLVVDPGIHLDMAGVDPQTSPYTGNQLLLLSLFEGSTIEIHDLDVPNLYLFSNGNGSLQVHDVVLDRLSLRTYWTLVELNDSEIDDVLMDMTWTMTRMSRTTLSGSLDLYLINSTMSVEDSTIVVIEDDSYVGLYDGVLEVRDSTIRGATGLPDHYNLTLGGRYGSTYRFESVVFEDIVVVLAQDRDPVPRDLTVDVSGCTFTGETSVLSLLIYNRNNFRTMPHRISPGQYDVRVSGNSFTGARSGLVISQPYEDAVVENNDFSDGARYYAQFFPDISHEQRFYTFINATGVFVGPVLGGVMMGRNSEVFVDATEDPGMLSEPGELLIALRYGSYGYPYHVLWFTTIDPSSLPAWIPEVDWGPFDFEKFLKEWRW